MAFGKQAVRFGQWAVASKLPSASRKSLSSASQKSLLSTSRRSTRLKRKGGAFSALAGTQQEEERLGCMGVFGKAAWKLWDSGNRLWLANSSLSHESKCCLLQDVLQG